MPQIFRLVLEDQLDSSVSEPALEAFRRILVVWNKASDAFWRARARHVRQVEEGRIVAPREDSLRAKKGLIDCGMLGTRHLRLINC